MSHHARTHRRNRNRHLIVVSIMPSSPAPLQPAVAVALYRALLRACRKGERPEVFGKRSTSAWLPGVSCTNIFTDEDPAPKLPTDAASVRSDMKKLFRTNWAEAVLSSSTAAPFNEDVPIPQPFEVLRDANLRAATLLPNLQDLPTKLPIFAYEHAALFPGEETTFRFFEPRYKRMVEAVTSVPAERGGGGEGWFLLRPREPYFILLRITEHAQLPNGDYAVNCMAGPRVTVLEEGDSEDLSVGASRLTWATDFELCSDDVAILSKDLPKEYQSLDEMRLHCLNLLLDATSIENILSISGPPLDPEAFSFFALRFITADHDVGTKWKWLACRSTAHRLLYVIDLLESFQESKRRKEESSQDVLHKEAKSDFEGFSSSQEASKESK